MSQEALIVQFKTDGSTADFDRLIEIEDALIQGFAQNDKAEVDGHDMGGSTMNIFVIPKGSWSAATEIVMAHLKRRGDLKDATIAKRKKSGSYAVVWPSDFKGVFQP